jgi:hypothetical protein
MVRGEVINLVSYWDQSHERLHASRFATASADDGGYAAAQTRAAYAGRLHPRCAQAGGLFATSAGYRNCRGSACAQAQIAYNSCRNRHCPKCQGSAAQRWLEARQADLLPVEYYHVVFSLPAPISAIAYTNKEIMYGLLFGIAAETLRTIAADPKHLGARIGLTLVLHTWGSALTHHPHVPGGGLSLDADRWVPCKPGFFLLVRVLSRLFRRRFLEELQNAHREGNSSSSASTPVCRTRRPSPTGSRRCASASGWSMRSAPSLDPKRCSPICRAIPIGWRSPTAGSSPAMSVGSPSGGRTSGIARIPSQSAPPRDRATGRPRSESFPRPAEEIPR